MESKIVVAMGEVKHVVSKYSGRSQDISYDFSHHYGHATYLWYVTREGMDPCY